MVPRQSLSPVRCWLCCHSRPVGLFLAFHRRQRRSSPHSQSHIQFFDFLAEMTNTAIAIPVATICLTYLVFSNNRKIKQESIPKAESPAQPVLAIWGLFWFTFVSLILCGAALMTSNLSRI